MEMLVYGNYIVKKPDRKQLKKNKFRYNKEISDSEDDFYSLRFPALRYNKTTTVDGEIIVNVKTGDIKMNAYNYGTRNCYPPFYQKECSDVYVPIITKINNAFYNIFNKIGVIKLEENNRCQI